jgi:hypothetical protein
VIRAKQGLSEYGFRKRASVLASTRIGSGGYEGATGCANNKRGLLAPIWILELSHPVGVVRSARYDSVGERAVMRQAQFVDDAT